MAKVESSSIIDRRTFLYQSGIILSIGSNLTKNLPETENISQSLKSLYLDDTLVFYGDSLTAGAGGVPYGTLVGEAFPGRPVITDAIGGQDSFSIATRQGGLKLFVSIEGSAFNGNELVKVTQISNQFLSTKASPATIKRKATVAGVKCTIIRNALTQVKGEESYHLLPDDPININVPNNSEIILDNAIKNRSATQILWMGRNNNLSKPGGFDEVKACIDKSIAFIKEPKRYIVLGILNGLLETQDTATGKAIMTANENLHEAYIGHFVSMQPPTDEEMTQINYLPTEQEKTELSKQTFPYSMRADNIHLKKEGYQIVANRVVNKIKELGY